MRAVYIKELLALDDTFLITNDKFHHLINVVRIKNNAEVLILDGKGNSRLAQVKNINKKNIELNLIKEVVFNQQELNLTVAIGKIKRDALELALKQLVEIGVDNIIIYNSKYSQRFSLNEERINKLLISSLEQSNSFYLPKIEFLEFDSLLEVPCDQILNFSTIKIQGKPLSLDLSKRVLMIIGPEGGLDSAEEKIISADARTHTIKLPTNILRASTAASLCCGFYIGNIFDV